MTQKAPSVNFKDKKQAEVFKLLIDSIKALMRENKEILWGSIPWVVIMLIMVALVILFPGMVSLSIQIFGRF